MKTILIIITSCVILTFHSCFSPNKEAIERLRKRILDKTKEYSETDVEKIKSSDEWIKSVSAVSKDEEEAIKVFDTTLKWRKTNINNSLREDSFPLEVYRAGWVNYLGQDKQGNAIFFLKLSRWRKTLAKFLLLYQECIVYLVEKYVQSVSNFSGKLVLIDDGSDLSTSNIDFVLYYFLASIASKYYSHITLVSLMVNFPALFEAPLEVVRSQGGKTRTLII